MEQHDGPLMQLARTDNGLRSVLADDNATLAPDAEPGSSCLPNKHEPQQDTRPGVPAQMPPAFVVLEHCLNSCHFFIKRRKRGCPFGSGYLADCQAIFTSCHEHKLTMRALRSCMDALRSAPDVPVVLVMDECDTASVQTPRHTANHSHSHGCSPADINAACLSGNTSLPYLTNLGTRYLYPLNIVVSCWHACIDYLDN